MMPFEAYERNGEWFVGRYNSQTMSNEEWCFCVEQQDAQQLANELNQCPYDVVGFYEEFIDLDTRRTLGTRRVETLDRPLGSNGYKETILTEPLSLTKGMKQIIVKASVQRPVRIACMLQILCGQSKHS